MYKKTRKDFTAYKYMNTGSGVYRKEFSAEKLGSSCWIWLGIIVVVAAVIALQ